MKIIADSNILFVEEAFKDFGELVLYKTRIEDKSILKDADALLCRSTMKIDGCLLEGSGIKFISTATSGIEHFDTEYLETAGIKYTDAKGSNSNSVAEYVAAAILNIAVKNNLSLEGKSIGIVGWGCVGKKVERMAEALGLTPFINDPPLEDEGVKKDFVPLDEILNCDIVTLHVPLNKSGKYKTENLFDISKFKKMRTGSIFINASRGKVVDEEALAIAKKSEKPEYVILDVWQNEPSINIDMFEHVDLATPHIAGHSFDGKALGTQMVFDSFCSCFGFSKKWDYKEFLPAPDISEIEIKDTGKTEFDLYAAVKTMYDIEFDDTQLRKMKSDAEKSKYFDSLRRNYRKRREFFNAKIICPNISLTQKLNKLGFVI